MVVPVIHDVFTITHQVSINYITLNPVVRVGLREDEVSVIPGSLTNSIGLSNLLFSNLDILLENCKSKIK